MKAEIREMVASGKTDREILELYKLRYGRRILTEPEGATWWVEMLTPTEALAMCSCPLRNSRKIFFVFVIGSRRGHVGTIEETGQEACFTLTRCLSSPRRRWAV